MKIISLNAWYGKRFPALIDFVRREREWAQIFCFQEVVFGGPAGPIAAEGARGNLFEEFVAALPGYQALSFIPERSGGSTAEGFPGRLVAEGARGFGLALFLHPSLKLLDHGALQLYDGDPFAQQNGGLATGNLLWAAYEDASGEQYVVGSVHGLFLDMRDPSPSKHDTPERIEQSRRLVDFFRSRPELGIIAGDFNLRPTTESIAILSAHFRNLVAEYGITNTRTHEYTRMEEFKDYVADYAFVDKRIPVKDFQVLPEVISDHAPLMLELADTNTKQ
jgi:Endonuclease/Exonuclease/phosphatase family